MKQYFIAFIGIGISILSFFLPWYDLSSADWGFRSGFGILNGATALYNFIGISAYILVLFPIWSALALLKPTKLRYYNLMSLAINADTFNRIGVVLFSLICLFFIFASYRGGAYVSEIIIIKSRYVNLMYGFYLTILGYIITIVGVLVAKKHSAGYETLPKNITSFEYGTKKCPNCAEDIKLEAKVCRYCKYTFMD